MGFKLTGGKLINQTNNKELCDIADLNDGICTTELSADVSPAYHITTTATLSGNFDYVNAEALKSLTAQPTKNFYCEYDIPILIQKRYHKKNRINKKWIKRYGFKKGVIHCEAPASTIKTTPQDDDLYIMDIDIFKLIMTYPKEITNNKKLLWCESNSI
jgi:hypothetical protein